MVTLDTHIILWAVLSPKLLSRKASRILKSNQEKDGVIICDISFWEIAMLMKKGRLKIDSDYFDFITIVKRFFNVTVKEITPEIANLSVNLSSAIAADSADRLIAATSIVTNTQLITADKKLRLSKEINTIW